MAAKITALKSKDHACAVQLRGYTCKDPQSTQAWFQLLQDPDAYTFALDFVSLLLLTVDSVNTIAK